MTGLEVSGIGRELLDDPDADPARVRTSLYHISRSNRWLGGHAAIRTGLRQLAPWPADRPVTLLDVGTGAGDVPAVVRRWGRHHQVDFRPLGLERSRPAARMAAGTGLPVVLGCGGALPFADRSVDAVVISQLAHHLDAASCIRLFQEADRVARHGVIVADLRRAPLAGLGYRVISRLLRFDVDTITDGIVSLRRGFSRRGLADRLLAADIRARVVRRPGARLVAVWRPT